MRKWVLGAAALLGVAAPSAMADAAGTIDLSYRSADTSSADIDGFAIQGAVAVDIAQNWGLEVHAGAGRMDFGPMDFTGDRFAAHVVYAPGDWLIGGFVGNETFLGEGIWSYGLDGQINFDRFSLTGSASQNEVDNSNSDFTALQAVGAFFITDNISVSGRVGQLDGDSTELTTLGLGGEFMLEASPVSFFAEYHNTDSDSSSADIDGFRIGVRMNFGVESLIDRQRTGPSLLPGPAYLDAVF